MHRSDNTSETHPRQVSKISITREALLLILTLVGVHALSAQAAFAIPSQAPLRIEDAIAAHVLVPGIPIALSPDGTWVAYAVQGQGSNESTNDERYAPYTSTGVLAYVRGSEIWITNIATGESRSLTGGEATSWGAVWSPDGKHLAFYSDRGGIAHLWVWDVATARMRQLSSAIARPFNFHTVRWTSDSRKILTRFMPEGITIDEAADLTAGPTFKGENQQPLTVGPSVTVYSSMPPSRGDPSETSQNIVGNRTINIQLTDLAFVDDATGSIDYIAKKVRPTGYWISPDAKWVVYTNLKGERENTQQPVFDIVLFDINTKSTVSLVSDLEQSNGLSVSWSPDSRLLAYTTAKGDCFTVSVNGGAPQLLTKGVHPPFDDYFRAPLWDSRADYVYLLSSELYGRVGTDTIWKASARDHVLSIVATIPDHVILEVFGPSTGGHAWSPTGRNSLIVRARDVNTKQVGFYEVDLSNGQSAKLLEEASYFGAEVIFGQDVSRDGETLAYVEEDAQHPQNIWIANSHFTKRRRISNINPQLSDMVFGGSRVIQWRSLDGARLHGALLLPAHYQEGTKYPLIVNVYGGAYRSEVVYRFGLSGSGTDNLQLFATRGYAVLLPDTPLRIGSPMSDLVNTVMPGVERVVELGIADADRVGVMGHSWGGYSTLALIVQTTSFKAAADVAGIADLISRYGEMDNSGASLGIGGLETGQGRMNGTPWEFRNRYIENSPIFYLDRVETPLLIIHGDLDTAVSPQQAAELFVGLRRLRKEVQYAKYKGEGHIPSLWNHVNQVDYCNRIIAWFDEHIKRQ